MSVVDNRISVVDNGTSVVDNRAFVVDNRISVVDNRISVVDNRTSVVDNRASVVDNRISGENRNYFINLNKTFMSNPDFIPRKDGKCAEWIKKFIDYVSGNYADWGIPQETFDDVVILTEDFLAKYLVANIPATRTSPAVIEKNEARWAVEKGVRPMIKAYITYNSKVTDADRINMGLPIYKTTRTPAPVPVTYPHSDVDTSILRRLTIHFYDEGSRRKAKPAGVHGCVICWDIRDTPPATMDDLLRSSLDTRTPFTLSFEENQRGKTVWFCLCWENTTGAKGPWSEIVSAKIP
jgi:hypothetical protein